MPHHRILFFVMMTCLLGSIQAQKKTKTVIKLTNPSFDGTAKIGQRGGYYISGWQDCGGVRFPGESPPDLQPGHFLVDLEAEDGDTYLGMVARDNDSFESVTQPLMRPLEEGTCYNFSLYLAASAKYSSPARKTGIEVEEALARGEKIDSIQHTDPIVLRIWGSTDFCSGAQLLGESEPIKNIAWKKFDFRFEPKQKYRYIMLEAF